MKLTFAIVAVLLLAGCGTAGDSPAAAPSPPPSTAPGPTAPVTPSADSSGLPVAVVRESGGLELFRVDPATRAATRDRVLVAPAAGAEALDVALTQSQVCATWHVGQGDLFDDPTTSLVCYPAGSSEGRVIAGTTQPIEVALDDAASRIAWAQYTEGENQVVNTALLTDGVLGETRRFLASPDQPETGQQAFTGAAVQDLAWIDEDELAISIVVESDDGPNLLRFDIDESGKRGWLDDADAIEVQTEGYLTYESVVAVDGATALAVERGSYLDDEQQPARAVRIDLATGRVLEVLATAGPERNVYDVSGSRDAVVYATGVNPDDLKAYLRLAGEPRGTPITGLPADVLQVVTLG